jgi:UDP-3-O-[3-hydroxymyristoyl] glucosamine N-acyltransferase
MMKAATSGVFEKSVSELAALTGGELQGDGNYVLNGAAGLGEAGEKDVSFLGNLKYTDAAAQSKAGCIFMPLDGRAVATAAKHRIYVEDPQWAFAQVLILIEQLRVKPAPAVDPKSVVHFQAKLGPNVSVAPYAVIERNAGIGEGTVIGAGSYIGENVRIGRNCVIHPRVVVRENCVIGDRVILQPGVVIGGDGYGFSTDRKTGKHRKIPQLGNVVIKDDVEIGANTTIDRATTGSTLVESGTKIDNLVQIAHNVQVGRDCFIVSQTGIAGSCQIGNRVILAGQAGLAGHLKIGDGAVIMAQTGVMSDVPAGQMLFGSPGRPHREAFKLQVLYGKLPELFDLAKKIQSKFGLGDK